MITVVLSHVSNKSMNRCINKLFYGKTLWYSGINYFAGFKLSVKVLWAENHNLAERYTDNINFVIDITFTVVTLLLLTFKPQITHKN